MRLASLMLLFGTIALLSCSRHRAFGVPQDHPTTSRRDTTTPEPELPSPPR